MRVMVPMLDPRSHLFATGNALGADVLVQVTDVKQALPRIRIEDISPMDYSPYQPIVTHIWPYKSIYTITPHFLNWCQEFFSRAVKERAPLPVPKHYVKNACARR